jgi:hypothetical protein
MRKWQLPKAALAVALILLGITPIAHANMVLELDNTHFKVEVIPVAGGGGNAFNARLTFMNTNMNNVGSMVGVLDLHTNVPASQITTQALVSTMEKVNFKLSTSADDPYTTELLFALSSDQGWTSSEITFEWFFSGVPGVDITSAVAMLDGIVAVEIIEGCKVLPPLAAPGLHEVVQDELLATVAPHMAGAYQLPCEVLQAFPNPTTGPLQVRFADGLPVPDHVRICSPAGQVLLDRRVDDAEIDLDLGGLAPGTYLLYALQRGKVLYTRRFQKL